MSSTSLPGRTVPIPAETPQEHLRNCLQILSTAAVDEFGCVLLTPAEYQAIHTRLLWAATHLDVRAALP
jgi:hypothetical protein